MNLDKLKQLLAAAPLTNNFMDDYECITREEHNLVVAMRNVLPELIQVVEAAQYLEDYLVMHEEPQDRLTKALVALTEKLEKK